MKKLFNFLLFSLLAVVGFAQNKIVYDNNAIARPVSNFHAIKVSHGIELLLTQGNEEAMAISADTKELRDAVKTEVVNGELRISIQQNLEKWWKQLRLSGRKVKAYVSFKNLDHIDASSGSKTTIEGVLNASDLSVDISSGASIEGRLKVNKLSADASSGSKSFLTGSVQTLHVDASSGAHFLGFDLVADNCEADASSGGKIELSVNKEINASASSGGGINYKGEASVRNLSTSSGGKVRKAS